MLRISNVHRETVPLARLIGLRYGDADRVNGGFGARWHDWMAQGRDARLREAIGEHELDADICYGWMRMAEEGFEYWIGRLYMPDAEVPEGFDTVLLPPGEVGVCWIHGAAETGEIFGYDAHMTCVRAFEAEGWTVDEEGWFCEAYVERRFRPDAEGQLILDYGIYLRD